MKFIILIFFLSCTFLPEANGQEYKSFYEQEYQVGDRIYCTVLFSLSGGMKIMPESIDTVNLILDFLERHKHLSIEIGAHTDHRGNSESNVAISQIRAMRIWDYLIEKGIPSRRISYKGYGEENPRISLEEIQKSPDPEAQEELHQMNRRIEIKITKNAL